MCFVFRNLEFMSFPGSLESDGASATVPKEPYLARNRIFLPQSMAVKGCLAPFRRCWASLPGLSPEIAFPQDRYKDIKKDFDQRNIASFLLSLSRCATCLGKEIEKFLSDLFDEPSFNPGYCMPDMVMLVISFQLKMTR